MSTTVEPGELVIMPHCAVCDARETLRTPLMRQPDGAYVCALCAPAYQRAITGASGASSAFGTLRIPQDLSSASPAAAQTPASDRPTTPPNSLYALLDVPVNATTDEIERGYKARQAYWMPRRAGSQRAHAEAALEQAFAAYELLLDPERRRHYDEQLQQEQAPAQLAAATSEAVVVPLEGWPGLRITSLHDLLTACEESAINWRIGESNLQSGELLSWMSYSLRNVEAARTVGQVMKRDNLSLTRKLNTMLYAALPERPYRFFAQPGVFSPISPQASVTDLPALILYADAHWDATVAHLYNGELITWLESRAVRGVYGSRTYEARAFFEAFCQSFAGTPRAGVGLELLLEFLDTRLEPPRIEVTFDTQKNGYSLLNWDGELAHEPVTMTIRNVTRGYFSGAVILQPPTRKEITPAQWLDTRWLPAESSNPSRPSTSSYGAPIQPEWLTTPRRMECELKGVSATRMTLYTGNFSALARGKTYTRTITLDRYEDNPHRLHTVATFPFKLRLMRFLAGYRLALWLRGLRGGIPGALVDGGVAFLLGWIITILGQVLAPETQWGFFPTAQDYAGNTLTFSLAIDTVLTLVGRSFFCAIAVFGTQLPLMLAGGFAFFGFFIGLRRGHSTWQQHRDRTAHGWATFVVLLALCGAATAIVAFNFGARTAPLYYFVLFGTEHFYRPLAYVITRDQLVPHWEGLPYAAVLALATTILVVGRAIVAVRRRLYRWVETSAGSLLKPPGKA
jgi:DnaJ domain